MMKGMALGCRCFALACACALGTSAWGAANGSVGASGAYVIDVQGADVTLSAEDVAALGTSVDLEKTGPGRLVINTDLKTAKYAGEIRVKEGYLRVKAVGSLGTSAKGTIVSDGATLEIDGSAVGANKASFVAGEPLTITGRGMKADGEDMGVIRNVGNNDQYPGICPVTMLGDCLYTTTKANSYRFDFRNGTVDMNGHTLRVRGYMAFTQATLVNPGAIVVEDGGLFIIESTTRLNGGAANTLTLQSGATFGMQGARIPVDWTIDARGGSTIATYTGNTPGWNVLAGPLVLPDGVCKIRADYRYTPITISGPVTGTGGLEMTSANGLVYLTNPENAFTGGLTLSGTGARVRVQVPGAVPTGADAGAVRLTGTSACLEVPVGDDSGSEGSWPADDLAALSAKTVCTGSGSAVAMYNEAGQVKTFADDVATERSVAHAGEGTLALTGAWSDGNLMNLGGEITVPSGKETHVRWLDLAGGTLRIPSGGLVYSHTNAYMGARWPEIAKILVEDGGCYMTSNASPSGVYSMSVGRPRSASDQKFRAVIDLQSGACMTGRVCVGYGQGSTDAAALYLRPGAHFRSWGTGGSCDMYVASGGSGYVEVGDDTYLQGWTIVGNGAWGRGVWVQTGGATTVASDAFSLGAGGGRGEAYLRGGTFTSERDIHVGKSVWASSGKGSHAAFTVAGDAEVVCKGGLDLAMQTNCYAALNLRGGVLQAHVVQKMTNINNVVNSTKGAATAANQTFSGNSAFVNFDGGTLKAGRAGELFPVAPDRVTVFAGGAAIDTAGFDCTVGVPLQAPEGKGVASIPLPPQCTVPWNYIGSPYITITGDGTNAWAHAVYDSVAGVVTGIEIVSPGTGYTKAEAELFYGGFTNRVVVKDLPLSAPANGGFTKKGAGALTLNAANAFTSLAVDGGTLRAGCDGAIPQNLDVSFGGGVLDGNGQTLAFGALAASSGGLARVAGATATALTKTGPGTFSLDCPVTFSGPVSVEAGTLMLPRAQAGLWEGARAFEDGASRIANHGTSPVFLDRVSTSLDFVHTNTVPPASIWQDNMNVTYSGYIWNAKTTDATWCFGGVLDDGIRVVIDGQTVLSATSWNTPKFGSITVSPGPHSIYILMYNGTGGAGATGCSTYYDWPAKHGLVWNPDGAFDAEGKVSTAYADYYDITDPAHGATFTLTPFPAGTAMPQIPSISVAAGATVDVGDGGYAFTTYRGLGNIAGSTSIANWVIDADEVNAGARMHVTGDLAFPAGAAFELAHADRLPSDGRPVAIATVDGTVTGSLPAVRVPGSGVWSVYKSGNELRLGLCKGTVLLFR